jgi:hypothetical protein
MDSKGGGRGGRKIIERRKIETSNISCVNEF